MKQIYSTILLLVCLATVLFSQPNWTIRTSGTTNSLRAVTYGNNQYVAVGNGGIILTSSDGSTWTTRTSGTNAFLTGVTYGNNQYVAVGNGGIILTSPNGVNWTTTRASGTLQTLKGVTYGNNLFVAVGTQYTDYYGLGGLILTSPDGTTWSTRLAALSNENDYRAVTYGYNKFLIAASMTIQGSSNGVNWSTLHTNNNSLSSIHYGNNQYVATGAVGTILTSSDNGITWTSRGSDTSYTLYGGIYGNNKYVVVGSTTDTGRSPGTVMISLDGIAWTTTTSKYRLRDVVYGNNLFVAIGDSGTIITSPLADAISYTAAPKLSYSVIGKTMQIYTLQGKLVSQKKIESNSYFDGKSSLYKNLSKGMYIVRIPTDNATISRRILVE